MDRKNCALKCARMAVGALFALSGGAKLMHPGAFQTAIAAYELLPVAWIKVFVFLIPSLEIVAGLALGAGVLRRGAASLLQALLLVFTIALIISWARGLDLRCGCFGSLLDVGSYSWWIARNIGLYFLIRLSGRS